MKTNGKSEPTQQEIETKWQIEEAERQKEEATLKSFLGSDALVKSCSDPFDYAMKLRTGEVITFSECEIIDKDWVSLTVSDYTEAPLGNKLPYPAPRGIDVRISDIVWVMDAPNGS